MSYSLRLIVDKAVSLIEAHGEQLNVQNIPGIVQEYKDSRILIIYTTPFSGLSPQLRGNYYTLDVWIDNKKVLLLHFKDFNDPQLESKKRAKWVSEFFALANKRV